ncbi:MAG: ABC transporter ATP-binding protein [Bdellovibrionales bacterium]|nr:ABC transporter ATP-binding protein [Bdellovibrionales bacterium]
MKTYNNDQLIDHYLKQEIKLPESLLSQWGKESILLYTMIDLNNKYQLAESWLILGDERLSLATKTSRGRWSFKSIQPAAIQRVSEVKNLSCNRLSFYDQEDFCLLTVCYSHRQNRTAGLIKFVIEQNIELGKDFGFREYDADKLYQEGVLKPVKEAQASFTGGDSKVVWRLLSYLKPYKSQVIFGFIGAVLMTAVSLAPAYITGYIVDHVIKPFQGQEISFAKAKDLAGIGLLSLAMIYILKEVFAWVRLRTMSILGEKVAEDLRNDAYKHIHKLSLDFFASKQTGSIISRVGSDTDRIFDFIAFGVVEVSTSVILLCGLSLVLIKLDWPLGLAVTVPLPFILFAIFKHGERMQELFLRAWRKWSDLTDCLSDTIPGIKVVKAFGRQKYETQRFKKRNSLLVAEFLRIHKAWTSFWPMMMLSISSIVVLVWYFGVPRVLEHIEAINNGGSADVGLSPGTLIAFVLYMTMLVQPIEVIGQMARMVNRATSSAQRVFEVLDTQPQIIDRSKPVLLKTPKGEIEFKNVSFSYDGVRQVLKNINFKIAAGEMIGLVGPSGGGKSTITQLMARFYETGSGAIFVDGINIKDFETHSYRSHIGMVLQDPYLFHGTVLENIRYARPEASLLEVIQAAQVANAHEFIMRMPLGYESMVGEKGQSLSGGERQRISIARAVLRNPKILILDEATSAVDTETEKKIQQALDRLVEGRTVIAIAHRLSTVSKADRLFVVRSGHLVEQGTHAELLSMNNGLYKKLVGLQQELQL